MVTVKWCAGGCDVGGGGGGSAVWRLAIVCTAGDTRLSTQQTVLRVACYGPRSTGSTTTTTVTHNQPLVQEVTQPPF